MKLNRLTKRLAAVGAAAACITTLFAPGVANAASLTSITLTPSNPTNSATGVTYNFAYSGATALQRCVRIHFSNSTTFSGTIATGMTFTTPTVTINGGQSWTASSTGDYVEGFHATGQTITSIAVTGIRNTSVTGSVYAYIETWGNQDCSTGGVIDTGTVATAITDNTIVSVTVDPSFTFTVANKNSACNNETDFVSGAGSATGVALGNMPVSNLRTGGQALSVSTNAGGGYSVYIRGTFATTNLRSAGHNWVDVTGGTYASPASLAASTEQFGYTYEDAVGAGTVVNPANNTWIGLDNATTNKVMDASNNATMPGTGCVSFAAQTGASTPAGVYNATVIYTAVPVY